MKPIIFRPLFSATLESDDPRASHLIASWKRAFPDAEASPEIDFEDWVENAVRLDSALRLAPERLALVGKDGYARYLDGRDVTIGEVALFLGAWSNGDDAVRSGGVFARYPYSKDFRGDCVLAQNYVESEVFRVHAGRGFRLCGRREMPEDRVELDIFEALADAYRAGSREVLIKVNLPKYALFRFSIPSDNPVAIEQHLTDEHFDFGLALVHLAGRDKMFMVQDKVKMTYEYRVIVIDHEPVAGAGCVEAYTPLDNEATWDPKMEELRSSGDVEHRADLARNYQSFAKQFTQAYKAERPLSGNYTLDLAVGEEGILAIELNPLKNYGLYAMDFDAILSAQLG